MIRFQTATQQPIAFTNLKKDIERLRQEKEKLVLKQDIVTLKQRNGHNQIVEKLANKINSFGLTLEERRDLIWAAQDTAPIMPQWFTQNPNVKFLKKHFSPVELMQMHKINSMELIHAVSQGEEPYYPHLDTSINCTVDFHRE